MANFAYQVTNFAYHGDGQFVYQGSSGGVAPVAPVSPGGTSRKKRFKLRKPRIPDVPRETNELVLELPQPIPVATLEQVMSEMEKAGFDIIETEDEDDALILTFALKTILKQ